VFQLLHTLVEAREPAIILVLLRFLFACTIVVLVVTTVGSLIIDAVAQAKQMHQIPCTKCRFFTNDYRLKCTVQPQIANTEKAINCSDYRSDE
jgi:hypothetical protein